MILESADKRFLGMLRTRGNLQASGITIHYSADRDVARTMATLIKSELGYHFLIARDGTTFQLVDTSFSVAHAGKAEWLGKSPNSHHIAICLMSWGKLIKKEDEYLNWASGKIAPHEVRTKMGDSTYWDKFTPEQEKMLRLLLRNFIFAGIDPSGICGHDESAIPFGRKTDPGASLSMSMPELRASLMDLTKPPHEKPVV